MDLQHFSIPTSAGDLAAILYASSTGSNSPTVILCHGFCGAQGILLPPFAEYFAEHGFNTLTFDYRGFGTSDGPRGRLVPAEQIEDIERVVEWTTDQQFGRRDGVGLWGTSLGGAHVIEVAARNAAVRCVVSQMAFADGRRLITENMTYEAAASLETTLDAMQARKDLDGREPLVAINRVLSDPDSKAFFEKARREHPEADVRIPLLTVREMMRYNPGRSAPDLRQPTLVVAAEDDFVNPPAHARSIFDALDCEKDWHLQHAARHYELYTPPHFQAVAEREHRWFAKHLR